MAPLNADDWLNLLSNKHRRKIIQLCAIRPCYPQEISRLLNLTPRAVMKHLNELEDKKIVKIKDRPRPEGGRNIKYYFVPFNPKFEFNLSNKDLVDIELVDVSDENIPVTEPRQKLVSRENLTELEINLFKDKLRIILLNEIDKKEAFRKYKTIERAQERVMRELESNIGPEKRVLVKIIRFLIERFGFSNSFSYKDLIDGLGVDISTVEEIITILSEDFNLISKSDPQTTSKLPNWKINEIYKKSDMDFI